VAFHGLADAGSAYPEPASASPATPPPTPASGIRLIYRPAAPGGAVDDLADDPTTPTTTSIVLPEDDPTIPGAR
jgi:hypothetical protein